MELLQILFESKKKTKMCDQFFVNLKSSKILKDHFPVLSSVCPTKCDQDTDHSNSFNQILENKISSIAFNEKIDLFYYTTFSGFLFIYSLITSALLLYKKVPYGTIEFMRVLKGDAKSLLIVSKDSYNSFGFIKYWNVEDNIFLYSYSLKAPWNNGDSMSLHPKYDIFLVANSGRILFFELHDISGKPIRVIESTPPNEYPMKAAFDFEGLIFAICSNGFKIQLYSCENLAGPANIREFNSFDLSIYSPKEENGLLNKNCGVTNILFTYDGKHLIIMLGLNKIFCIDSFNGNLKVEYHKNIMPSISGKKLGFEESNLIFGIPVVSSCSNFILCGSSRNLIYVWKIDGTFVTSFEGHCELPKHIEFHVTRGLIASACKFVIFWQNPKSLRFVKD